MKAFIKNITDDYQAIQQEYFKYLHAHPELSFEEHETSAYIQKQLQDMGIELLEGFSGTSVVARLDGPQDGPVIAFRADIDALPIQETTGLSYHSVRDGVMHA